MNKIHEKKITNFGKRTHTSSRN